ncbi:hypothetical protein CVT26_003375 [Gymnopilus dilepis]|uniref:Uncharacterized protein n=1 Tax=Gymnopilus dilepis TaxID=231916 RepID=A0A409Y5M5_9AGAR|nr:hypothetical protein CVT26_003375 [Gymnopilus dilepis]
MPLPSWKQLWSTLGLRKEDARSEDIKNLITEYVRENMDIDMLSSEHPDDTYRQLFNQLADKYGFIRTSNNYPDDPTTHEKVIRACAMRTHNTNRSMSKSGLQIDSSLQTDEQHSWSESGLGAEAAIVTSASKKRRVEFLSPSPTSKKARQNEMNNGDTSDFLSRLKDHGTSASTFSAKLLLNMRSEDKVDPQIQALRNKSFSQIGVFAKDVADLSKPSESRWQVFLANELMWEYSRGL